MSLQFKLAVSGKLQETMEKELKAGARAVKQAVSFAARKNKEQKRDQVNAVGLGRRMGNTIRDKAYPEKGDSLGAASIVYSRASYMYVFEDGVTIRAKNGKWLAIPTQSVPKHGRGNRWTPEEVERRWGVTLRFVRRNGGVHLLVLDGARVSKTGRVSTIRASKATKNMGARSSLSGRATVVMFLLIPQVSIRKRLNFAAIDEAWGNELPNLIVREWEQEARKRGLE